jgi:hypothetical protein
MTYVELTWSPLGGRLGRAGTAGGERRETDQKYDKKFLTPSIHDVMNVSLEIA